MRSHARPQRGGTPLPPGRDATVAVTPRLPMAGSMNQGRCGGWVGRPTACSMRCRRATAGAGRWNGSRHATALPCQWRAWPRSPDRNNRSVFKLMGDANAGEPRRQGGLVVCAAAPRRGRLDPPGSGRSPRGSGLRPRGAAAGIPDAHGTWRGPIAAGGRSHGTRARDAAGGQGRRVEAAAC